MATQHLVSSVRPQRTAFLINQNDNEWQNSCLRLINFNTQVWGGQGSIFVPTDGNTIHEIFWTLLDSFEPDHIGFYRKSGLDVEKYDPERFALMLQRQIESWERQTGEKEAFQIEMLRENLRRQTVGDLRLSESLHLELRERLNPFHIEEHVVDSVVQSDSKPNYPETALVEILLSVKGPGSDITFPKSSSLEEQVWLSVQTGYLDDEVVTQLCAAGVSTTASTSPTKDKFTSVLPATPGFQRRTSEKYLSDLNLTGLALYSKTFYKRDTPTLIVVGRSLQDFCYYQCLSRLRPRVLWLPPWMCGCDTGSKEALHDDFHFVNAVHHLTTYSNQHDTTVEMVSLTLGKEELNAICEAIRKRSLQVVDWRISDQPAPFIQDPMRIYEANNVGYPQVTHISGDNSIELFTPRPLKTAKGANPQKVRWISELRFPGMQIPRHPSLASHMMGGHTSEARTSRNALAFLNVRMFVAGSDDAETAGVRPTIRLLRPRKIFEVVASAANLKVETSDKGIYSQNLIEKFGGLKAAADFLKSVSGRRLVDTYQGAANKSNLGVYLNDERRRYLDFAAFKFICGDEVSALDLIDRFSKREIVYRGFIFQCEHCRRAAWYAITELSDTFECRRCHRSQIYTSKHWRKPEQPVWYHQLDEVIYQALVNDCDIPILAMASLSAMHKGEFTSSEELQYRIDEADKPWLESDLNCLIDGRIVIGEAKKANRLAGSAAQERVIAADYLKLAELLGAESVVFATAQESWREATIRIIQSTFKHKRIPYQLLTCEHIYRDSLG